MPKVMKQLKYDTDLRRKDIDKITYDDCFNAVDIDPMQIKFVPEHLIDKTLCYMAVYRKGSNAFNDIPSKFIPLIFRSSPAEIDSNFFLIASPKSKNATLFKSVTSRPINSS